MRALRSTISFATLVYEAWSAGELTRDDLREYALDYYEHVRAFPSYLAAFGPPAQRK